MFDFSKVSDFVTGLASDFLQGNAEPQGLMNLLQNAGINPSELSGLGAGEIMNTLAERGIDVTQIAPAELQELLANIGSTDQLAGLQGLINATLRR